MKNRLLMLGLLVVILAGCTGQMPETTEQDSVGEVRNAVDSAATGDASMMKNIEALMADAKTKVVAKKIDQGDLKGYLATPQTPGNYPSIIMIHEWWGLNENIMKMADLLAGSGYNVLAIDLFGEVAVTPERARELSGAVRANPQEAVRKMQLGVAFLKEQFGEQSKIASLGWCFGGQQSLQLSLNEPLDATVIYYGNLETDPEKLKNISQPVLGVFGSADTAVPIDSVRAFETALHSLNVEQQILVYDGLGHAFANPSGDNYAPKETLDAWQKTLAFLERNLK